MKINNFRFVRFVGCLLCFLEGGGERLGHFEPFWVLFLCLDGV